MFWLPENEDVKKRYIEGVGREVKKQLEKEQKKKNTRLCKAVLTAMLDDKSEFYYEKILGLKPDEMMDFYHKWRHQFPCNHANGVSIYGTVSDYQLDGKTKLSRLLKKCFSYQKFSDKDSTWEWNAYRLGKELGVEVCPYCGRQFIHTVITAGKKGASVDVKLIRAEFDHYIPKAKFPMFALSFYNLIPSCHFCNSSIKNTRELSTQLHIHPYRKTDAKATFKYHTATNEITLEYEDDVDKRLENTCDFFRLEDIYQCHIGIAEQYYQEAQEFSTGLLEEYQTFLENNLDRKVSKREIFLHKFRISDDTENEILGKLRMDLVEGIIEKYR